MKPTISEENVIFFNEVFPFFTKNVFPTKDGKTVVLRLIIFNSFLVELILNKLEPFQKERIKIQNLY